LLIGDPAAGASPFAPFGLAAAKSGLAGEIAEGVSLADIAQCHHVTYGTARSQ
jgi:hypothetical protein